MAQVLIRNIDDDTLARLKAKAEALGISLEAHLRELLSEVAKPSREDIIAEIDAIRSRSRPWRPGDLTAEEIVRQSRDERTEQIASWLSTPASPSNGSSKNKAPKTQDN